MTGSGQTRSFGDVGSMSGLPESGHGLQPAHDLHIGGCALTLNEGLLITSTEAASRRAMTIERVAEALLVEDEPVPQNGPGIVRAHGVMRP